jgi:hypothetical protein
MHSERREIPQSCAVTVTSRTRPVYMNRLQLSPPTLPRFSPSCPITQLAGALKQSCALLLSATVHRSCECHLASNFAAMDGAPEFSPEIWF